LKKGGQGGFFSTDGMDDGRGDDQEENRCCTDRHTPRGVAGDGEAGDEREVLGEFGQEGGKNDSRRRRAPAVSLG
jgi:hypothetical protein